MKLLLLFLLALPAFPADEMPCVRILKHLTLERRAIKVEDLRLYLASQPNSNPLDFAPHLDAIEQHSWREAMKEAVPIEEALREAARSLESTLSNEESRTDRADQEAEPISFHPLLLKKIRGNWGQPDIWYRGEAPFAVVPYGNNEKRVRLIDLRTLKISKLPVKGELRGQFDFKGSPFLVFDEDKSIAPLNMKTQKVKELFLSPLTAQRRKDSQILGGTTPTLTFRDPDTGRLMLAPLKAKEFVVGPEISEDFLTWNSDSPIAGWASSNNLIFVSPQTGKIVSRLKIRQPSEPDGYLTAKAIVTGEKQKILILRDSEVETVDIETGDVKTIFKGKVSDWSIVPSEDSDFTIFLKTLDGNGSPVYRMIDVEAGEELSAVGESTFPGTTIHVSGFVFRRRPVYVALSYKGKISVKHADFGTAVKSDFKVDPGPLRPFLVGDKWKLLIGPWGQNLYVVEMVPNQESEK